MWNQYFSVSSVAETLDLLNQYQERARIIAGGTDLLLELEHGKRPQVEVLIDITRIKGLDNITLHGNTIRMGALVNHNHVVGSALMRERALPLAQACWEVGAPQIRNRATIAGNLITGSAANDTIVPLMALGAEVTLSSVDGERTIALKDFYTGLRKTVMRPNEMLTSIAFPALSKQERGVFLKLGLRKAQAISVTNATVVVTFEQDIVTNAVITLGSVAPTIIRVPVAEQALVGRKLTDDIIRQVARLAGATPAPIDDVRSTAEYRTEMVKVLVARALRVLASNTQSQQFPDAPTMLWGEHEARVNGNALNEILTHNTSQSISATINGQSYTVNSGQHKTLLDWLREDVGLLGTKEGCGEGECGACTVFLDGSAVMSCMVAAPRAHGAEIITIEGLQEGQTLHPLQETFIQQGAVQCGYCTPGLVMAGAKLLEEHPMPTQAQIEQSISGNLCRCTGYYKIVEAIIQASEKSRRK
jgi:xanthine dehydrogenase iron-sulfur cluster and FAD-binding subunit A